MLWKATRIEIKKLLNRGRSYIGVIAVIVILVLIEAGMLVSGKDMLDALINNIREDFYLQGNLLNGYLVTYFALNTLWIHIPILIVIVTGDLVSGESSSGTFRLYLTRPVSRNIVISAKFIAGMLYSAFLVTLLALFSMGLGLFLFGKGDLVVLLKGIIILPAHELPLRFFYSFVFGIIGMCMVGALSFFFSCLYENSITPILITMALIILFTILSNFELGFFDKIKPFLFTTYISDWRSFFEFKINTGSILKSGLILIGHILALYVMSLYVFNKKDITT